MNIVGNHEESCFIAIKIATIQVKNTEKRYSAIRLSRAYIREGIVEITLRWMLIQKLKAKTGYQHMGFKVWLMIDTLLLSTTARYVPSIQRWANTQ